MKNIPTFEEFVNESLNEGLAAQGGKFLRDFTLQGTIDAQGGSITWDAVVDTLDAKPKDIIYVDGGDLHEPLQMSIYGDLKDRFKGTEDVPVRGAKYTTIKYDPKLKVIKITDNGSIGYYFTAKSNF